MRAFDADAAVGLDNLSRTAFAWAEVVAFRVGVGTGGAFLAFASDAAVGAYNPDGVFGLATALGVFEREGVDGALIPTRDFARTVDVVDVVDCPVS